LFLDKMAESAPNIRETVKLVPEIFINFPEQTQDETESISKVKRRDKTASKGRAVYKILEDAFEYMRTTVRRINGQGLISLDGTVNQKKNSH